MAGVRLTAGTRFAHYVVESRLGEGGVGVVYLARDLALGRKVALKLLSPALATDAVFRTRFVAEAESAAALDHPHVLPVYEAGEADGQLYLAMRYVPGFDLGTVIARDGALPLKRARRFLEQIASALDAAHAGGLVHRDVKPANVLVAPGDHAYLADFGLARPARGDRPGLTQAGQLVGTVDYLAPEVLLGAEATPRSDLYALGCLFVECLSGVPPFRRNSELASLYAQVNDPIPTLVTLRPDLPAELDPAIQRILAKRPEDRPASAAEFAQAVGEALDRRDMGLASVAGLPAPPPAQADATPLFGRQVLDTSEDLGTSHGAHRFSRRLLIASAGAAGLAASAGLAITRPWGQSVGGSGGDATAPPITLPAHGPLIFELDRTPLGSERVSVSFNNPSSDRLRFTGSAVEFSVSPGSWVSFSIKDLSPDDFVADISVLPVEGEGAIALWFRGYAGHQDQVRLAPLTGELTVQTVASFEANSVPTRLFGPATRVAPSRAEERSLAVSAHGKDIVVFLGTSEVARVRESVAASGVLGVVVNAVPGRSVVIALRRLRLFGP
jgi:serine/threonine-protein kinase